VAKAGAVGTKAKLCEEAFITFASTKTHRAGGVSRPYPMNQLHFALPDQAVEDRHATERSEQYNLAGGRRRIRHRKLQADVDRDGVLTASEVVAHRDRSESVREL